MGEGRREALRVGFDRLVKIEFRGAYVTSDGELLAFRELDRVLGLSELAAELLQNRSEAEISQVHRILRIVFPSLRNPA